MDHDAAGLEISTKAHGTGGDAPKAKQTVKRKGLCFIISPFGGWNDRYYTDIYCPAVQAAGLQPTRADDLYRPSAIVHDIWDYVKASKVMLADLTGKNPNVFYELGLAHAVAKPVVLVTQSIDDVPFDLRALRVIEYDVEDPEWGVILKGKIQQALKEVLESPQIAVLPSFLHAQAVKKQTTVSPLEKRLLELQSQVERLTLESRSKSRPTPESIGPEEAQVLLERYLRAGMPQAQIFAMLTNRGAPASWVQEQIVRLRRRLLSKRTRSHGSTSRRPLKGKR